MFLLRRIVPLFASLAVHGGVFVVVLLYTILPALGFAAFEVEEGEDDEAGEEGAAPEGESLDEYLARSQDQVDVGEPTADIVGITILPEEVPAPVEPVPTEPVEPAAPAPELTKVEPAAPKPVKPADKAVEAKEPEPAPEAEVADAEAIPDASASEVAAVEAAVADKAAAVRRELEKGPVTFGGKKPWTPKDSDPDDGITRTSRTGWTIDRSLLDYYATHIPELMKLGSVRPHKGPDGKYDGFRLKVRKGSLLKEAGLRSGDVVRSVNGVQVHDVVSALDAYFKLRKSKHVELVVVRKGETIRLSYDLI